MARLPQSNFLRRDFGQGVLAGCIITYIFMYVLSEDENSTTLSSLFSSRQHTSRFQIDNYPIRGPVPWSSLNKPLQDAFTLNGKVQRHDWYLFGDLHSVPAVIDYSDSKWGSNVSRAEMERLIGIAKTRGTDGMTGYGGSAPRDIYAAIAAYPVKGKSTLVIGTLIPWIEAILLVSGAKSVSTVDFNKPVFDMPGFRTMSIDELDQSSEQWEAIFSYSSIEHDGLGRYGDPIHPNGDFERMKKIKTLLAPGGKFYLSVPIGFDSLYWNAHRIYGRVRFPMLIKGWKLLGTYTASEYPDSRFDDKETRVGHQPVFVLES